MQKLRPDPPFQPLLSVLNVRSSQSGTLPHVALTPDPAAGATVEPNHAQAELMKQWKVRAMAEPRQLIKGRWENLELQGKPVIVHETATPGGPASTSPIPMDSQELEFSQD